MVRPPLLDICGVWMRQHPPHGVHKSNMLWQVARCKICLLCQHILQFWFTMGTLAIVLLCNTAVLLMVFTVSRMILKTSSLIASNWASEHDGTALGSLGGFWGLVKLSMAFCCCSTRANNHLISWLWALTSSACWRCMQDNSDTCS